jgi:signal transduction histidine kinase
MTEEKTRILLVDDEPQVLAALRAHLRKKYEVFTAECGDDGLERIREYGPFAVVVADMRMPGMNGVEFLREAFRMAPDTVRILLTGYTDVDSAIGAVNEGRIFRFLTKPCPPPEFMKSVAEAVSQHREVLNEREYVRGEKHRVSQKTVKASRMAALGKLATGAGRKLSGLARSHNQALDDVMANAATGGFVSPDDLKELRRIERVLARAADRLAEYASEGDGPEPVDMRDIVQRSVELLEMIADVDDVVIETEMGAGVPEVVVCQGQLEQVVVSVLTNALEAVRKTDRAGLVQIRVHYDQATDEVVCEVRDNGCGIHPEARPFVLRPFFSTKTDSGAGLGLSVARKLLKSWEGRLSFDSTFQRGSSFRVHLPSAADQGANTTSDRSDRRRSAANTPEGCASIA